MLNPGEKGWLKEYLDFRKEILTAKPVVETHKRPRPRHPDESLYGMVQPTGLMYGHPMSFSDFDKELIKKWGPENVMKVLLAESLINSSLIYHESEIQGVGEFSEVVLKTIDNITGFYNKVYPELSTSEKTFFGKKKPPLEVAEKILEKRIGLKTESKNNFWINFFQNSLLFLDIYFFGQWIHTNSEKAVTEFFRHEKEDLRFSVIRIIVAAAHANGVIEKEERKLFEFFLDSSDLNSEKKKEATHFLEVGVDLSELEIPGNSWILKKYFLELAILTVWADKIVEDSEVVFLENLAKRMGLSEEDLENSMMAIEGFVIEYWDELGQLQSKHDLNQVSEKYLERISHVVSKNKNRITSEINESRQLKIMLDKYLSGKLSKNDEEKLRAELVSVLKTIPTFVIISLPTTFLSLPILMKILPKSLFPEEKD